MKATLLMIAVVLVVGCASLSTAEQEVVGTYQVKSLNSYLYEFKRNKVVKLHLVGLRNVGEPEGTWSINNGDVIVEWPSGTQGETRWLLTPKMPMVI